jgi:hypothetical protein
VARPVADETTLYRFGAQRPPCDGCDGFDLRWCDVLASLRLCAFALSSDGCDGFASFASSRFDTRRCGASLQARNRNESCFVGGLDVAPGSRQDSVVRRGGRGRGGPSGSSRRGVHGQRDPAAAAVLAQPAERLRRLPRRLRQRLQRPATHHLEGLDDGQRRPRPPVLGGPRRRQPQPARHRRRHQPHRSSPRARARGRQRLGAAGAGRGVPGPGPQRRLRRHRGLGGADARGRRLGDGVGARAGPGRAGARLRGPGDEPGRQLRGLHLRQRADRRRVADRHRRRAPGDQQHRPVLRGAGPVLQRLHPGLGTMHRIIAQREEP